MTIKWSLQAQIDYWSNIEYLENDWSENDVISFIDAVNYNIGLLATSTVSFSKTRYQNVFKVVISKQITLFYSTTKDTIILLRFWNNYQNLSNFKLR